MEPYGFHFRFRECGQPPTVEEFVFQDTEVIHAGDLVSVDTGGYADLAATGDAVIVGAATETVSGTAHVSKIKVIVDADAVYAVTDASARDWGTPLDIAGTTGAMTLATDSNHNVVVMRYSPATEPTLVKISAASHPSAY
jgi:hypothetical protein